MVVPNDHLKITNKLISTKAKITLLNNTNNPMTTRILITMSLFLSLSLYGQQERSSNSFEEKGIKIVSNDHLTDEEVSQILNFNFEDYRKQDVSVVIKVLDGPYLELYSQHSFETGERQEFKTETSDKKSDSMENVDPHDHVLKGKTIKLTFIDIYGITINNETK